MALFPGYTDTSCASELLRRGWQSPPPSQAPSFFLFSLPLSFPFFPPLLLSTLVAHHGPSIQHLARGDS